MARETSVEVNVEFSSKYENKTKIIEKSMEKISKKIIKLEIPEKTLNKMAQFQSGINKTNILLQKIEKQLSSVSNLAKLETALKVNVKVSVTEKKSINKLEKNVQSSSILQNILGQIMSCQGSIEKTNNLLSVVVKQSGVRGESENPATEKKSIDPIKAINNIGAFINSIDRIGSLPTVLDKFKITKNSKKSETVTKTVQNISGISTGVFKTSQNIQGAMKFGKASGLENVSGIMGGIKASSATAQASMSAFQATSTTTVSAASGAATSLGGAIAAIATNPITWIVIGIALAIGAFVLLYKKCEWFRNGVNKSFEKIKPYINQLKKALNELGKVIMEKLGPVFEKMKPFIKLVGKFITKFIIMVFKIAIKIIKIFTFLLKNGWSGVQEIIDKVIEKVKEKVQLFIEKLKEKWNEFLLKVQEVWNVIVEWIQEIWGLIKENAQVAIDWMKEKWNEFLLKVQEVWNVIVEWIQEIWGLIKENAQIAIDWMKEIWVELLLKVQEVWDVIVEWIQEKWELIKENVQTGITFITELWDTISTKVSEVWQGIVDGIGGFIESMKEKVGLGVQWIKNKFTEIASSVPFLGKFLEFVTGKNYSGTNYWRGGLTYVGERGRELIQYPTGERVMAEAKMLMNLPKGTKIFRNSKTEKMLNKNVPRSKMTTVDENNQLRKLGGFNGLSGYTDFKFSTGAGNTNVQTDNITINITNTYGNQSPAQIKDTNTDLVKKINEVLFQNKDRQRRVSIG